MSHPTFGELLRGAGAGGLLLLEVAAQAIVPQRFGAAQALQHRVHEALAAERRGTPSPGDTVTRGHRHQDTRHQGTPGLSVAPAVPVCPARDPQGAGGHGEGAGTALSQLP